MGLTTLFVNGDSHTAGSEAIVPYGWAMDDPKYKHLGKNPHPLNLAVSWGKLLADLLGLKFIARAQDAASNERIIRTTKEWVNEYPHIAAQSLVIIGWPTWEREEWVHNGEYYQVNGSGIDTVPPELEERYKEYVRNINWDEKTVLAEHQIEEMHSFLEKRNIPHVFFNTYSTFKHNPKWTFHVNPQGSYFEYLDKLGCARNGYHFGVNGHTCWAEFMLNYIKEKNLI